ncbi:hypothetical protein [Streptomyces cucumeris]|uniref:hypothetical protein n=1 Tax=Streptomyces cucumeris TaxID=2962890 RepID=UPI0020C8DA4C|nr:hypothetical protein [Streptomyces sp. NEAU-Y11]MCP9206915.1 hypothetical protein [Streptomyces sp. NEAU-Y11]
MPRRPPAAVRAALSHHPRHPHPPRYSVVDGVSAATLGEIHRLERARGKPGVVARDLASWRQQAAQVTRRAGPGTPDPPCPCCEPDPEGRPGLERVLGALSRRARRELAAVVEPVDGRVLTTTYGPPPDIPGWWERRY